MTKDTNHLGNLFESEQEGFQKNGSPKPCPFLRDKLYTQVRDKLKLIPEQQEFMRRNIRISPDGKLDFIKLKKKISVLSVNHYNGKDIVDGSQKDKHENIGRKGLRYFTGRAAKTEAEKQGKQLLKGKIEVLEIIRHCPGRNIKEKILNLMQLLGLEKSGYWNPFQEVWDSVDSISYIMVSEMDSNGNILALTCPNVSIDSCYQGCPRPAIVREPSSPRGSHSPGIPRQDKQLLLALER